MTRQESIFEVAKTLYLVDKLACYNQLKKIDFNELNILFGKDSEIEVSVKNLMIYLEILEDIEIPKTENISDEIMRVYGSINTPIFNDSKTLASYLFSVAIKKSLILESALNISADAKVVQPNISTIKYFTNVTHPDNAAKDDILSLVDLFNRGLLLQERLDAFIPTGNSDHVLYKLKVMFATKQNMCLIYHLFLNIYKIL